MTSPKNEQRTLGSISESLIETGARVRVKELELPPWRDKEKREM